MGALVDLVVPPLDEATAPVSRAGFFPPLGLLSIATYAGSQVRGLDIRIRDGNIHTEQKINIRPMADIVGFSPSILSYEACLRLAEQAKANGSLVVLGGYHASSLGERILRSNPFVDFVVKGDGEVPFAELVKGSPPNSIPGLTYRTSDGICSNAPRVTPLDHYPRISRSLLDRRTYITKFQDKYNGTGFHVPDLVYSQKDCMWSAKTGGCVFCARIDRAYRARSPISVWDEIIHLRDVHGTDYVWDVAGSFIGNPEWIRDFHAARPGESGVALEIYARASELLAPGVVQMLKDVGVHKVFMGAESGDERDLRMSRKGSTPGMNLRAARICAHHGISLVLGFVVGLPGESLESIDRTLAHARQLTDEADVETISCCALLPIPGSQSFEMLCQHPATAAKYAVGDNWDVEGMQRDWLKLFTTVSYETAVKATEAILSYAPTQSAIIRFKKHVGASNLHCENYLEMERRRTNVEEACVHKF